TAPTCTCSRCRAARSRPSTPSWSQPPARAGSPTKSGRSGGAGPVVCYAMGMDAEQNLDVQNLIVAIHQDREAAKDKERREAWTKYVSLMIVILAAGACGGGGDRPISFTPVSATSDGALYTLTLGDLKMVVDASTGA